MDDLHALILPESVQSRFLFPMHVNGFHMNLKNSFRL